MITLPLSMFALASSDPVEHVQPVPLFHLGPFVVTNQMFMAVVAAVLMAIIFPLLFSRRTDEVPTGARNFFEAILEFLRVEVFRPALKENTDRFLPFLWTLFFYILFCNLLGQIPVNEIVSLFTGRPFHWGGTATGAITTTAGLAVCSLLFIHVSGIYQIAKSLIDGTYGHHEPHEEHTSNGTKGHEAAHDLPHLRGEGLAADIPQRFEAIGDPTGHYHDDEHVRHGGHDVRHEEKLGGGHGHGLSPALAIPAAPLLYLWNFAPHPFKPAPGGSPIGWLADVPMWAFLLLLELIGAVIKPFALMIRLFANMIAGHIVLAAFILLIPVGSAWGEQLGVGIPVTILGLLIRALELFVAVLQSYIFAFLTTLFIASAVAPEH